MGLKAERSGDGGSEKELCPAGPTPARLTRVVDLGKHTSDQYKDKKTGEWKASKLLYLAFELPKHLLKEGNFAGKPFLISTPPFFTNTRGELSNLRKMLDGWVGPLDDDKAWAFDLSKLLGTACYLNVVHNVSKKDGKTYANIGGIMPLPEGMECAPQDGETVLFDLDEFDAEVFDSLPDWQKEKIGSSNDFAKSTGEEAELTDKDAAPFPG